MLEFDIPRVNKKEGMTPSPVAVSYCVNGFIKSKNWTTLLTALKQIKKLTSVIDEIEKDLTTRLTMYVMIFT